MLIKALAMLAIITMMIPIMIGKSGSMNARFQREQRGKQTLAGISEFCQSLAETMRQGQRGIRWSAGYHLFSQKSLGGLGELERGMQF